MVAVLVLTIGVLGTLGLLDSANRTTTTNNARMGATNLAREILEDARSLDYDKLTPTQITAAIQAKKNMEGTGTPWKVQRRGIEYTVATEVCVFDDPKDNVSVTPPANVCTPQAPVPASAGTLLADSNPDDFRRVKVTLTWTVGGGGRTLAQTSLLNNPSGGLGPRITTFSAPPDNVNQLTSGSTATFPTTTTAAAAVHWDSDGNPSGSGDSTGGPTSWTTSWPLGSAAVPVAPPASGPMPAQYSATTVLDGIYTVTAQAFDDRSVAGDSRAATLPLNRSFPLTVNNFEAGRNTYLNIVDFVWDPNPERDIAGYRVYNTGPDSGIRNGNDVLVCSTDNASKTSCSDPSPAAGSTIYYVAALDHADVTSSASAVRESTYVPFKTVTTAGVTPLPPILLPLATADPSTGKPRLSWSHLDLANVRFFRIYRTDGSGGCCTADQRYDSTPANATSWTDPTPGTNQAHRYWVTAVGPTLNESDKSSRAEWIP